MSTPANGHVHTWTTCHHPADEWAPAHDREVCLGCGAHS